MKNPCFPTPAERINHTKDETEKNPVANVAKCVRLQLHDEIKDLGLTDIFQDRFVDVDVVRISERCQHAQNGDQSYEAIRTDTVRSSESAAYLGHRALCQRFD